MSMFTRKPAVVEPKTFTDEEWKEAHFIKKLFECCPHTPDIAMLEQYQYQLLFVCDDMMQGHPHHGFIDRGIPLFDAFTRDKFAFWKYRGGPKSYPIPLPENMGHNLPAWQSQGDGGRRVPVSARIKGEVYAVRPSAFILIDNHRANGVTFQRQRVKLIVPYKAYLPDDVDRYTAERLLGEKINGNTVPAQSVIPAWMYQGKPNVWSEIIDGGYLYEPVKAYKIKDEIYFNYFSNKEYDDKASTK